VFEPRKIRGITESLSARGIITRVDGEQSKVRISIPTEPKEISLEADKSLTEQIAHYLYREVEIEALVVRNTAGLVVSGKLNAFDHVSSKVLSFALGAQPDRNEAKVQPPCQGEPGIGPLMRALWLNEGCLTPPWPEAYGGWSGDSREKRASTLRCKAEPNKGKETYDKRQVHIIDSKSQTKILACRLDDLSQHCIVPFVDRCLWQ